MISYIMPARNAEKTIRTSVLSTLSIMSPGDELIVVDDASSDGTSEILISLGSHENRMIQIKNTRQLGVAGSLNVGLAHAQQSYVGRIDADDICLPWRRFGDLHQIRKGFDFGFSAAILFGSGMRWPLPQFSTELRPEQLLRVLAESNPFVHSTMIARKSAIEKLGGYREVIAEDYDLWIRAAEAGYTFTRSCVPKILYRIHEGQVTAGIGWSEAAADFPARAELRRKLGLEKTSARHSFLGRIMRVSRK